LIIVPQPHPLLLAPDLPDSSEFHPVGALVLNQVNQVNQVLKNIQVNLVLIY
jgi:hypothetical protein